MKYVYIVIDDGRVHGFDSVTKAAAHYRKTVEYYRNHQPNENDRRTYKVVIPDDGLMHWTLFEKSYDNHKSDMVVSWQRLKID